MCCIFSTIVSGVKFAILLPLLLLALAFLGLTISYTIKASSLSQVDGRTIKSHFGDLSFYAWDELFWWSFSVTVLLFFVAFVVGIMLSVLLRIYNKRRRVQEKAEAIEAVMAKRETSSKAHSKKPLLNHLDAGQQDDGEV